MVASSSCLEASETINRRPMFFTSGIEPQDEGRNTPNVGRVDCHGRNLHGQHFISNIASIPITQFAWRDASSLHDPRYEMGWGQPSLGCDVWQIHDTEVCSPHLNSQASLNDYEAIHSSSFSPLYPEVVCPPPTNIPNWYYRGPQPVHTMPRSCNLDRISKTHIEQVSNPNQAQNALLQWADPSK